MTIPSTIGGSTGVKITSNTNEYVDGVISTRPTFDKILSEENYVTKSFFNRNSVNADRFNNLLKKLKGYAVGSEINTTYFHKIHTNTANNSMDTDISTELSPIHKSFLQINNFEIKLQDQFQFNYDTDKTLSTITGTALVYPGFVPNMGDCFIYQIEPMNDGRISLFKVTQAPSRLSIRTSSFHEVTFELIKFATVEEINDIRKSVKEVAWFNKKRFLTEETALILSNEKMILSDSTFLRSILLKQYNKSFYNNDILHSYIRPDGIYDPYIVDFITDVFTITSCSDIPQQLLHEYANKEKTIWKKLQSTNAISWQNVDLFYYSMPTLYTFADTTISTLINKNQLSICKFIAGSKSKYPVFKYFPFYIGIMGDYASTDFEKMLSQYLNNQTINPTNVFTLCKLLQEWNDFTEIELFYMIPVLIHFLNEIILSITTGRDNIKITTSSDIENFISEVNTPVILTENDLLPINVKVQVSEPLVQSTIPECLVIGTTLNVTNTSIGVVYIYSNIYIAEQQIVEFSKTGVKSNRSAIPLGTLLVNGNVTLVLVDVENSTWLAEASNGFILN